jgi:hypothetical protein
LFDAAPGIVPGAKYQPLRIADPTPQMHLGSARTIFLDYGASRGWNKKPPGAVCMQILEYGRISNARHFTLADRRANPHHYFALFV